MATCVSCHKPLILLLDGDDNNETEQSNIQSSTATQSSITNSVPDDVLLNCGCHFHWQCLLDAYEVTSCPACGSKISSSSTRKHGTLQSAQEVLLVTLHNEGGLQENLDILPLLLEESYLKAYPDERKSRAFLEFVREGDGEAVVDLIRASLELESGGEDGGDADDMDQDDGAHDEDDEDDEDIPQQSTSQILRYRDPLDSNHTALHIATSKRNFDIIWLLLLLGSTLPPAAFPDHVQAAAMRFGVSRADQSGLEDVRALADGEGRTAYDIAVGMGLGEGGEFDVGLLAPPIQA